MLLFRLDASIREEGSRSREYADIVEKEWLAEHPDSSILRRSIGTNPLPSTLWATAVFASRTPEESRTTEQKEAVAQVNELADELINADALLIATPLYNFGVSQHLKAWMDVLHTDPRISGGALEGKPTVLVVVRGGAYGPGTPREGWDHSTGWVQRMLHDVWKVDLRTVEVEFTLVGVNPALDEFKDMAAVMQSQAADAAVEHGRNLAKSV